MPQFVYQWHVNLNQFSVRAVVGPVTPDLARSVDRVLDPDDVEAVLEHLDADCAPPWCVHGSMHANTWAEVEARVRGWHFT